MALPPFSFPGAPDHPIYIPLTLWEMYVVWVTKMLTRRREPFTFLGMNRSKRLTRRRFVDHLQVCTCAC
ncbi:hypothetical protein FHX34_1021054 [Actinoplanes teichomyceticus]|uniref:Uncharacterized protein n=1 Tax=Actinoplanes teichomyceticus TaxID=1867 RepID=A0A561WKV6_ACTTI|nr:hypothetical protein FHX34_1021054 [Actinoplanes teichomyceticus]GIF17231.1 hypothetical protein Ate01nite_72630 [Actinoplanes teichomyceticus]